MRRPLDGVTVVALEQVIAGPFCTRQLAELGARVIKIERPGSGDQSRGMDRTVQGLSSHFVWVNRSKESLCLDLKRPEARQALLKLVGQADVFLQNLAPGAADRLGVGPSIRGKHPRLIWCGISGYGPAGPYASKKAYDLLVQCEAALLSVARSMLAGMTRTEARQWADQAIRINTIAPSTEAEDGACLESEPDIAALALFLASPRGRDLSGLVFDMALAGNIEEVV